MVVARKLQNCPCGEALSSPAKDKEKYNKIILIIILIIKQIINKYKYKKRENKEII
jgi:hypothetical protein